MTHTPGPWKVGYLSAENAIHIQGPEEWLGVATAYGDCLEETKANADLIAKAWLIPELVAALEGILAYAQMDTDNATLPLAAIWIICRDAIDNVKEAYHDPKLST